MKLRVSCAQIASHCLDPQRNLALAEDAIASASAQRSDLVLFPEYLTTNMVYHRRLVEFAEPIEGPTVKRLESRSRQHGCWVAAGLIEREGAQVFNTLLLK